MNDATPRVVEEAMEEAEAAGEDAEEEEETGTNIQQEQRLKRFSRVVLVG